MWRQEFVDLLRQEYAQAKKKNSKFSMRAFALKLGVSSGSLSSLFNQSVDWNISIPRAKAILDRMNLPPSRYNQMLVRMNEIPDKTTQELGENHAPLLTDWTYFPILLSFDLPSSHHAPENIAERLGLSTAKVNSVIEDLLRRELLTRDDQQRIVRRKETWTVANHLPKELLEPYHRQNMELTGQALQSLSPEERAFHSLTFVGNRAQLSQLKKDLQHVINRVTHSMDDGPANNEVFRLSLALFPINFARK